MPLGTARPPMPGSAPAVEDLLAPGGTLVPGEPARVKTEVAAPQGLPDLLAPGRTLVAGEPGRKTEVADLSAPGRTLIAEPGRKTEVAAPPGLPDLSAPGRTLVVQPGPTEIGPGAEPAGGAFSARTEAYPGTGAEVTRASESPFSVRTEANPGTGATRAAEPAESPFSVRTEAYPGTATRPTEPAQPAFSVKTEISPASAAAAPGGTVAPAPASENTLPRESGSGTPEQLGHVFVRAADVVPPASEPARAREEDPAPSPVATPASAPQEPPLLDLLAEALKTSGQELPTLSEWAGAGAPGKPGAKER